MQNYIKLMNEKKRRKKARRISSTQFQCIRNKTKGYQDAIWKKRMKKENEN